MKIETIEVSSEKVPGVDQVAQVGTGDLKVRIRNKRVLTGIRAGFISTGNGRSGCSCSGTGSGGG